MKMNEVSEVIASSFRDPSGFVFRKNGSIYRQVNESYKGDYESLMSSGLYEELSGKNLLIPHEEVDLTPPAPREAYKIIKPRKIQFISYPYEWCFSQFKDAALTTLKIQEIALEFGMSLKDSSAFNIQFNGNKPVHIDTLSFEEYREGQPWVAYRQFCQHFLAPLAIMSYTNVKLNQLLRIYLDGIPLDLASSLLPLGSRFRFTLLSHIHFHARSQEHFSDRADAVKQVNKDGKKMSRTALMGLIDSLESAIKRLTWKSRDTLWSDYYGGSSNYSTEALDHKKEIVGNYLDEVEPDEVWDLGANVGLFSQISSQRNIRTISFDFDPGCVEANYLKCKKDDRKNTLPLLLDLTNPTPGIGWQNEERMSLAERGPTDAALALALVHHLAISNNTPLPKIADFFSQICRYLIIEFIPKDDKQIQKLLASRKDVFTNYSRNNFIESFERVFSILSVEGIMDSERSVYLMESR